MTKNIITIIFCIFALVTPFGFVDAANYLNEQEYFHDTEFFSIRNYIFGNRGKGVKIAIIDDGVWLGHKDLVGQNYVNEREIPNNGKDDDGNGYSDDYYGWNFVDKNSDMTAKGSHGTAVAGIISAKNNDDGIEGMASDAKFMPLIVCGEKSCKTDDIIESIKYAADNGADIINLSLGSTNSYVGYSKEYSDVIGYAYNKGVVVVAALGNGDVENLRASGLDTSSYKVSPACNDSGSVNTIIAVGALASDGVHRTNWSNYGVCADVFAPGEDVLSTAVPAFEEGYGYKLENNGTSFSAPMVTAAVAILKSNYPVLTNTGLINSVALLDKGILNFSNLYYQSSGKVIGTDYNKKLQVPVCVNGQINSKGICEISNSSQNPVSDNASCGVGYLKINNVCEKINIKDNFLSNEKKLSKIIDKKLSKRLSGKFLLQKETGGQLWYIDPKSLKKYYIQSDQVFWQVIKKLGIKADKKKYADIENLSNYSKYIGNFIWLDSGSEAFYVFDKDTIIMLDNNKDIEAIRSYALGIKNSDIRKISVGE